MKKLLKLLGALLALVVIVVLAAIVIVPMVIDGDDIKAKLSDVVKSRTGRELTIPGEVNVSVFPWLGVKLGRIEFGNAPGFSAPLFAASDKVDVQVKLMPLLKREVEMSTVTVHGLSLNLERDAKGKANWEDLAGPSTSSTSSGSASGEQSSSGAQSPVAALAIGGLEIKNATVSYADALSGQALKVAALDFTTGQLRPGQPVDVALGFDLNSSQPPMRGRVSAKANVDARLAQSSFHVRGLDVTADLKGETLPGGAAKATMAADLTYDGAQHAVKVTQLVLSALDLKASGALTATGLDAVPSVVGELDVAPFDLRQLMQALGVGPIATADDGVLRKAALTAKLGGGAEQVKLEPLTVTLDDSTLSGQLAVSNFSAPAVRFDLGLDQINLDRYLPPASAPAASTATSGTAGGTSAGVTTPGTGASGGAVALPMETLRALDVVGTVKAGAITVSGLSLRELSAKIDARKGVIKLSPIAAQLYQGSYAGNVVLDARQSTPSLALNESVSNVAIAPLLKDLNGDDRLSGTANLKANLTASGVSEAAIKKTLNGDISFQFLDGALKGVNIGKMIREAKASLSGGSASVTDEANKTDFAEISGTAKVTNGVINNQDLSAKSPLLRVTGKGTASLPAELIDYKATATVVATSKGQGGKELQDLAGVPIPVHVTGSFAEPKYALDVAALGEELAKTKAKELVDKQKERVKEKVEKKLGDAIGDKAGKLLGGDKEGGGGLLKNLLGQ